MPGPAGDRPREGEAGPRALAPGPMCDIRSVGFPANSDTLEKQSA